MASLARTVASLARNMASLASTVASLAHTVPEPFPTNSLPLHRGPAQDFHNERGSASLWVGLDGVGRTIESVLQFSSYFVGI